jgi:hypothetical protein
MIVFEEKFRELISLLPPHEQGAYSFPVRYDWGTIIKQIPFTTRECI